MPVFRKPLGASGRIVSRVVLLTALAVASVALTHCRMVGDRTTGISASVLKAKSCLGICLNNADAAIKDEDKTHKKNLHDCGNNASCVNQENARHDAATAAIFAALDACRNNCHQQGGGSVGP